MDRHGNIAPTPGITEKEKTQEHMFLRFPVFRGLTNLFRVQPWAWFVRKESVPLGEKGWC